ncbi:MAG: DUF6494 family protein [Wenzhouxiangellaceae bacterium]|nr:DUF6494 family protein [Wenzhouxiangellaceae bacterium]
MDEEKLNLSVRKFLKQVGVTSQRELEKAVRAAELDGSLPAGALNVKMTLDCPALNLRHEIDGSLEPGK